MKRFLSILVFGLMAAMVVPAFGQLPGLSDDDINNKKDDLENDRIRPRTINVTDRDRQIKIVIKRSGGIEVSIARNYSLDEIADLRGKFPKLVEAIDEVPSKAGAYDVEMTIALSSTVKAPSLLALKEKSPIAFEYYRKYHNQQSDSEKLVDNNDGVIGDLINGPRRKLSYTERNERRDLPKPSFGTPKHALDDDKDKETKDVGDLFEDKNVNDDRKDVLEDLNEDRRKKKDRDDR